MDLATKAGKNVCMLGREGRCENTLASKEWLTVRQVLFKGIVVFSPDCVTIRFLLIFVNPL